MDKSTFTPGVQIGTGGGAMVANIRSSISPNVPGTNFVNYRLTNNGDPFVSNTNFYDESLYLANSRT